MYNSYISILCSMQDSNLRPFPYKRNAATTKLIERIICGSSPQSNYDGLSLSIFLLIYHILNVNPCNSS